MTFSVDCFDFRGFDPETLFLNDVCSQRLVGSVDADKLLRYRLQPAGDRSESLRRRDVWTPLDVLVPERHADLGDRAIKKPSPNSFYLCQRQPIGLGDP